MIFPITDLLDQQESEQWVQKHFHSRGLRCPGCHATIRSARQFRRLKCGLVDYRCQKCQSVYNLYTGTIFAGSKLAPSQVVLLLRGFCKGEPATVLAEELALSRRSVHKWRQRLQQNAYLILSQTALRDAETETDEMFQNAGEKRRKARGSAGSTAAPSQQAAWARHL
jgi:transposase-like protein